MTEHAMSDTQMRFVTTHLRARTGAGAEKAPAPPKSRVALAQIMITAQTMVEARTEKLRAAMIAHEDEDFTRIAKSSLLEIGRPEARMLIRAIEHFDAAEDVESAQGPLRKAIRNFRDRVLDSPDVDLIDSAPFDIPTKLRATYQKALGAIDARL